MILILTAIILVLFIAIAHLCFDFYKQKRIFESRIDALEDLITVLTIKRDSQSSQLKLSDSLFQQLKKSNDRLNETIYDVNIHLFATLFNKKKME